MASATLPAGAPSKRRNRQQAHASDEKEHANAGGE
jgi:hypothetical protein